MPMDECIVGKGDGYAAGKDESSDLEHGNGRGHPNFTSATLEASNQPFWHLGHLRCPAHGNCAMESTLQARG